MSVDNGIYILLDMDGKCVVFHSKMSDLTGLLIDKRNPWIGYRDFKDIYRSIYGHGIYEIKTAMNKAVNLLEGLEACEYGIVTIPLEVRFDVLKAQYLEYMNTLLNNFIFTDEQRTAVRELAGTGIFKDMLITEWDDSFTQIYVIAENCYRTYSEKRNRQWNEEAESWIKRYETLV